MIGEKNYGNAMKFKINNKPMNALYILKLNIKRCRKNDAPFKMSPSKIILQDMVLWSWR